MLDLLILHYIILLHYIMLHRILLHLIFIFLVIYNLNGNNGKVKLQRSRLRQLDNPRRKPCEAGWCWRWQHNPTFVFPLIYIFFEVMLLSGMDEIGSCLDHYILLLLFGVCLYFLHSYVRVLSLWKYLVLVIYHCLILDNFISFF